MYPNVSKMYPFLVKCIRKGYIAKFRLTKSSEKLYFMYPKCIQLT